MMQGEHRLGVQDVELMPKQRISASNTEAYGWQRAPRYIIRDRDRVYGRAVLSRLRAMVFGSADCNAVAMAERMC